MVGAASRDDVDEVVVVLVVLRSMEEVEEGTKDSPPIARSDAMIAMADIRTMICVGLSEF